MNAAKAASRMRSRTAVSSPPFWRRLDIDVAIALSLTTLVPYRTITSVWYRMVPTHDDFARNQRSSTMKIEMSYLLLAFATVLAPLARGQSTPPQPKITGVLTILSPKPGVTPEQVMKIMPAEIRATVPLYLDGKIQQWFTRGDGRGVILILNCKDVAEARALIESLPLAKENLMDEQFIPVGPLLPLGILLRDSPTNK